MATKLDKIKKSSIIKTFAKSENDTGSCDVQIALLSERIVKISEHLKNFPKDTQSKLGLIKLVGKRRTFYNYLKKHEKEGYEKLIKKVKDFEIA